MLAKPLKNRYSLFQQPKLLAGAPTTVTWHDDAAEFTQTCPGVDGYAYAMTARLSCQGKTVTVDWALTNTGRRPFTTRQYVHNFFRFDGHDVGPGYVLRFPYDFSATGMEPQQRQVGREIRFVERIPRWVNLVVPYPEGYTGPNRCIIEHADGQRVTCETSMPGLRTAVHARPMYLAPEQFIELKLAPGQTVRWRRAYTFEYRPGSPRSMEMR